MRVQDDEHGRTWRLETEMAVVGFRYKVYIEPFPNPVAWGWSEGDEANAYHLLVAQMRAMNATPAGGVDASTLRPNRELDSDESASEDVAVSWCHECDKRVNAGHTCPDCGMYLGMKLIEDPGAETRGCSQCGIQVAGPFQDDDVFWCPSCMGEVSCVREPDEDVVRSVDGRD